ncbi:MAG TPA: amidohydrolase family protein [Xanthobacteraceae bacterium]|jgi:guanine deaminase|nr:amidohydrolase family protein [Xanthobacteraceae bacterium]
MTERVPEFQVIRGGLVLDVERRSADFRDILIKGGKIHEVGAPGMAAPAGAVEISARDKLLIPGLVNAHTHGHGSLGKGLGDKWSLELYLSALAWVGGGCTLEDKETAAQLNAAEMILKGCTAAYDMYVDFPVVSADTVNLIGRAYENVGVRAVLAPMMSDKTFYQAIPGLYDAIPEKARNEIVTRAAISAEQHLKACRAMLHDWPFDRQKIAPALGPTIPLHCSEEFMIGCRDLAREYGVEIQMHLGETKVQAVSGIERYGKSLTAYIDGLGMLGPNFTGSHCIWLDNDDLRRLRDKGAKIAHNPGSNMRIGSGIAPAREIIDAGILMGIGSDGSATSDNQNMFEAMRMAALVSRVVSAEPDRWLGVWDVLSAATENGAKVLGFAQSGRLSPGYNADIVFLDLGNINFVPLNSPANQVVFSEDSSAVESVMAGGRMVLQNRRFTSFDYDKLREKVQRTVQRLKEANAATKIKCEAVAEYVMHHCSGLNCSHYAVERRLNYDPKAV